MVLRTTKTIMGRTIKRIREERGISCYALAQRAGVDSSWLRRVESGKSGIRLETVFLLAYGLGMTAAELVTAIENDTRFAAQDTQRTW